MVWLALIGVAIWLIVQHNALRDVRRELGELRRRLPDAAKADPAKPAAPATGVTPAMEAAARTAAETVAFTPKPAAPTPTPEPAPVLAAEAASAPSIAQSKPEPLAAPLPPAPVMPTPRPGITRAGLERWVAEKGLAWIGGSAIVIGAAFLVGYAAQRGFFGPQTRILAAVAIGFLLIGASELVRRRKLAGFGGHQLASAILAGAGAAVLYGACWAAYALYHFIGGGVCAGLLAIIAWSLLGLAFVHGEALAILALGGAFVVPLLSGASTWGVEALTLYLGILITGGGVIGRFRDWPAALWTTIVGASVWALLGAAQQESLKSLLLGLGPLAVISLLAVVRPRPLRGAVGAGAVIAASLTGFVALAMAYGQSKSVAEGIIAAVALPLMAAALQRRGQTPAWIMAAPGAAFTLAALVARQNSAQPLALTEIWCLQIVTLTSASLWAGWGNKAIASGAGALGALALALVAGAAIAAGPTSAIAPAVACVALALGAARLATDRKQPVEPRTLEIWSGASAAGLLAAIAFGLSWRWAPLGFGVAMLGLAGLGWRLKWRSIAGAAAAAGALGLVCLMSPDLLTHALGKGPEAWIYLSMALFLGAGSFFAARVVAHQVAAAETLRTVSPIAALIGAFIFLRWWAGGGTQIDDLTEAGIRTILLGVAGLVSLARFPSERTAFARWRGHALLALAALHGGLIQVLLRNPRFGFYGDTVAGPLVFDSLAVAYAAPALIFGAAAIRIYRQNLTMARLYALIALGSTVLWSFLEIRRIAHGPHLSGDGLTIGAAESTASALVLLALAALADRLGAAKPTEPGLRRDASLIAPALRMVAVAFALVMAGLWSNPCWGPADRAVGGWGPLVAIFLGYGLCVAASGALAVDASREGKPRQSNVLAVGAISLGMIAASLVVRAAWHGTNLTLNAGVGQLETWSYSGLGAVVGLGFVGLSRRGGRLFLSAGLVILLLTAAKVFIIDTSSLSGVVRAGSFLALGALLLLGALTARRVIQSAAPKSEAEGEAS